MIDEETGTLVRGHPRILSLPMWRHTDTTSIGNGLETMAKLTEVRGEEGVTTAAVGGQSRAQDLISYQKVGGVSKLLSLCGGAKQRKETKIALTVPAFMALWDIRSITKRLISAEMNSSM